MGTLALGLRLEEAPEKWAAYEAMLHATPAETPVALTITTQAWRLEEEHSCPLDALSRLAEARRLAEADCVLLAGRQAQSLDPEHYTGSDIDAAYRALARERFRVTGDLISSFEQLGLWERAGVAVEDKEGRLVRLYIGLGHAKRFGNRWCREAIGQPLCFDVTPRGGYQAWATAFHERAFAKGIPQRHAIDAVIQNDTNGAPARVNYDRLAMPVRLLNGQRALFMVSQVKPGLVPLIQDNLPGRQAVPADPSK